MRVLHFADLHIGIENYGRPLAESDLDKLPAYFAPGEDRRAYLGQSTRLVDFLSAFDQLVEYALTQDVDLVLFSGDAYKAREPTQTHQREFAKRILRLSQAGVPVFLLVGNHDLPHAGYKATAVEIFDVMGVPHVTVADRLGVYSVRTRHGAPLQVIALPWIRRSAFLNRDDTRNLPFDEINRLVEARLTEMLADSASRLDPSVPAVLSGHVTLGTARLGTEKTMMMGRDYTLLQSSMGALPVDYIGLGHIHLPQQLATDPPVTYPGSLQRVDFGEEDHAAKGFYVLDLDPAKGRGSRIKDLRFQPVDAREFATVEATVSENDLDATQTVVRAIGRQHVAGAIVRVQVKLPAGLERSLREQDIRRALTEYGAHTVTAITRLVDRPQRTRLAGVSLEGKAPAEALAHYWTTTKVSPERAQKLARYAERLMQEHAAENEGAVDQGRG